jgi:hypothetical protein
LVRKLNILIAVLYPVAVIAVFFLTMRSDQFAVFEPLYSAIWLLLVPGILILLTIGLAFTGKAPGHRWRLALIFWIALVTFGHYSMIGSASAGI